MNWPRLRKILRVIMNAPTAPFHEYHVRDAVLELLGGLAHVSVEEDGFGNLVATYRRGRKRGRYAFGAHMDHPGWIQRDPAFAEGFGGFRRVGNGCGEASAARCFRGKDGVEWRFLGGVPEEYLADPEIEEFGEFGMWRLPAMELREGMIYSRACDDLVNCATMVAMLAELEEREVEATCYAIFTRAEEVGFVGAVELARHWPLPESAVFISLETSSPAGEVRMGEGPVLRVGDRMSIFDDGITREIGEVAAAEGVGVQRSLLDRGSCEASAIQAYGIPCGGLSILLGNYHNCGGGGRIEAEYVSVADTKAMVELLVALVETRRRRGGLRGGRVADRRKMEERVRRYAGEVRATRKYFTG